MPATKLFREAEDGIVVYVHLTPNASRDALDGLFVAADGSRRIKARVRAQPEKGRANKALLKLLAKNLCMPRSNLSLVSGAKDRRKSIFVAGRGEEIKRVLAKLTEFEE